MLKNNGFLAIGFALGFLVSGCKEIKPDAPSKTDATPRAAPDSTSMASNPKPEGIPLLAVKDEWVLSASLAEFKADLVQAMKSNNQEKILSAFSDILEFNPGTASGPAGVVQVWGLDGSKEKLSSLIGLLDTLISSGGCFIPGYKDSSFVAPSYNCLTESDKARCGESGCGVVTKSGVHSRKTPDDKSSVQALLNQNEILPFYFDTLCNESFTHCDWRKIKRANGEEGFIPTSDLRTGTDGEIHFVKEKTGWKIRALRADGILTDDT